MKRAVQFGAGNIGRGFLGQLYFESGYETTFVDVAEEIVAALKARREYPLRIVDERTYTLAIRNVSAIHARDTEVVATALAQADLAATAVGVNALPKLAPAIAAGIEKRFRFPSATPLNIIVCENMLDAGNFLREEVRTHLAAKFYCDLDTNVGFVEASIGRMVPVMTDAMKTEDPLLVCVEAYCELPVDAEAFRGPIPVLKNLQPRANFGVYVERKLFVHNASHAGAAYLGYLRGHEYIWQAIQDPKIRVEVDGIVGESCAALATKHGLHSAELRAHADDLIRRFQNRGLGDQVTRVAKDPLRKLGPNDRLIGAANLCLNHGVEPEHVAFAAAAAFRYDHPADPAAKTLQTTLQQQGLGGVFKYVCQIEETSRLAQLIREGWERLAREGWIR
ncbi:MAG: mannitol-1-phosphate 5-dehydrogenase [Candidatus Hydrogenedentes bacterium]|nr:mannitol-1-phosphate 5-dehydrogenase [Candidatus Hydrogenedentota bacterium]